MNPSTPDQSQPQDVPATPAGQQPGIVITQPPLPPVQPAPEPVQQPAPNPVPQPQPAAMPAPPPPQNIPAPEPQVVAPQTTPQTPPQKQAGNPNSTQNSLQVAEVRDGIVIMNDGSFRSVVMLKSINFDLMSQQEQEAVEFSYQGFLNSLYFPVQIFIRSQKVDLQPYIEKLDKIRTEHDNMLLAMLMEDYLIYIDQLAQQTNIMDKKFYVVIPYFPKPESTKKALKDSQNFVSGLMNMFSKTETHVVVNEADLEAAKTELRNRVQAVLAGLNQSGVQGLPLDTQELIELYYDTYNPDTATRQELKDFNSLTADVVTKGQGTAQQAHLQRELQ